MTAAHIGHRFPGGCAAHLLCDPGGWAGRLGHAAGGDAAWLAHLAWPAGPLAAAGVAAVTAAGRLVLAARRDRLAGAAQWVEIACPPQAGADGGEVLWRLLAPRIGAGRVFRRRRTIAWEARATPAGVRAGLWVPATVPAAAVAAAVRDAWPGTQARAWPAAALPAMPGRDLTVLRLRPRGPDWLPVCPWASQPARTRCALSSPCSAATGPAGRAWPCRSWCGPRGSGTAGGGGSGQAAARPAALAARPEPRGTGPDRLPGPHRRRASPAGRDPAAAH